jgi:rare lipoprotein A
VSVFAPSLASWYGPGLYGGLTACGMQLTPGLIGVAHRWLPCGTRIEFSYRGRSLVVPVIDRGPFASSASWDLTGAAAAQLGFHGVGSIGTLPAPSRAKVASAG